MSGSQAFADTFTLQLHSAERAGAAFAPHFDQLPIALTAILLGQAPTAFAAFLVGLAAGRRQWLADPGQVRGSVRKVQAIGFPIGVAGAAVYAWATVPRAGDTAAVFALAVDVVTAPLLAAAYAATLLRALSGQILDPSGAARAASPMSGRAHDRACT